MSFARSAVSSLALPEAGEAAQFVRPPAVVESSALDLTLRALRPLLTDRDVTEICINRPGEAYVETRAGWRCVPLAFATFDWCHALAKLVANSTRQRIDAESPLLSAALPAGERIQIVLPPATTPGTVAITIRRPADEIWTLEELEERGLFRATRRAGSAPDDTETELTRRLDEKDYRGFLRLAVARRRNILVSGPTGSGKTTFTKALIREIPSDERLITIEDAKELVLDRHDNHVRLFYSKDDQGLSRVTPKQLLESCLRMKPDRILLAELRGEEAFDYLRNVNSGHPGSITSIHAASAELAFEQLVLLVKQSRAGQELAREEIKSLLYLLIDVIVQFGIEHRQRCIKEIWYDPARKHRTLAASR
ncbi:MAG: P-type DNA transfer ATPase VirB11 [Gammaproteobacteria bacterium]